MTKMCDKCGRGFGSARLVLVEGLELCGRCARDVSVLLEGWVIVHESGVIFDAAECVLVDTDLLDDHDLARLSGDDYFDDSVIDEIANRCGVPIIPVDVGGFVHDGNDWSHCGRVVYSGDLWAECVKCGAVMSWDDDEVTA